MNPLVYLGTLSVAACAIGVNRRRAARAVERAYASTRVTDADGIVLGAQGFTLRGTNGRGLLLLHGSGDSPQSLRYLAGRLHAAGYTVHAPLLPGHGRSPRAFATARASEYVAAARSGLATVRASAGWVGVIGLSMGAALAAQLAKESPDVRVLVLLAPYLITPPQVRVAVWTRWLWSPFVRYVQGGGDASVHDDEARVASHAYGTFSAGALEALDSTATNGRRALPALTLPTLVVNSEQDNRIPPALMQQVLQELRMPAQKEWVGGCGHVITVDYCKGAVADHILGFLARHAD